MAFTGLRVSAMLVCAVLALPTAPDAAQRLSTADANDFQMFRHSIAVRRNARVCEHGAPEYRKPLADSYARWSEKHGAAIARGESLFKQALKVNDPKRYPYIDQTILTRVGMGLAELNQPPKATDPTPPATQTAVACERLLTFLKQN